MILKPTSCALTAIWLLGALDGAGAQQAGSAPQEGTATCTSPVKADDTARTLLARYRGTAEVQELDGAEGEKYKALVLFPQADDRRLEVSFTDDAMTKVSGLRLSADNKKWSVAGLTLGATLEAVQRANGKDFTVAGFGWDYGGYVTDLRGGKLAALPGGCSVSLRFGPKDEADNDRIPKALLGDGVKIVSSDARLRKLAHVVVDSGDQLSRALRHPAPYCLNPNSRDCGAPEPSSAPGAGRTALTV